MAKSISADKRENEKKRLARRAEKQKHIVLERFIGPEVVAYGTVHNGLRIVDFMLL